MFTEIPTSNIPSKRLCNTGLAISGCCIFGAGISKPFHSVFNENFMNKFQDRQAISFLTMLSGFLITAAWFLLRLRSFMIYTLATVLKIRGNVKK